MNRRKFTTAMGAVVAGMVAGSKAFAGDEVPPSTMKKADAGKNDCKGKGGCSVPVDPAHFDKKK